MQCVSLNCFAGLMMKSKIKTVHIELQINLLIGFYGTWIPVASIQGWPVSKYCHKHLLPIAVVNSSSFVSKKCLNVKQIVEFKLLILSKNTFTFSDS